MYGRRHFPSAFAIERRDMDLYGVPLFMYLLGFGMGTLLVNSPVWYYVGVKIRLPHVREECESNRVSVFRCLMFGLSVPCELLFYRFHSWT